MNLRALAGAISLSVLLGLAVLAGGAMIRTTAAAPAGEQVGAPAQQATATATAVPNKTPGTKPVGPDGSSRGGRGGGHGGRGGFGPGHGGAGGGGFGATAEGAGREISGTTQLLALVKADLDYAAGKMDTANAQDWLNRANGLLGTAQAASGAGEYGRAAATAHAARELGFAAQLLLRQELGAGQLPSSSQRGYGRPHAGGGTLANITQAQASRVLAGFNRAIVGRDALVKSTAGAGDAATYLTTARSRYSAAYAAYQAGNYTEAAEAAVVGEALLRVVDSLLRAATAPNSSDAPVQVPAPNF